MLHTSTAIWEENGSVGSGFRIVGESASTLSPSPGSSSAPSPTANDASSSERSGTNKVAQPRQKSIYPGSKAYKNAKGPKHALYTHTTRAVVNVRRSFESTSVVDLGSRRSSRQGNEGGSETGATSDLLRLRELSKSELMDLIRSEAQKDHLGTTIAACNQLKSIIVSDEQSGLPRFLIDRSVYKSILEMFGLRGMGDEAYTVIEDMKQAGIQPDVQDLDHALAAGAKEGNEAVVLSILREIGRLSQPETANDDGDYEEATFEGLIDIRLAEQWTPATFTTLFRFCTHSRNLELALSLFAVASQLSAQSLTGEKIGHWIRPEARGHLINLAVEVRELGIALDVARMLEDGHIVQPLIPSTWMTILRGSASEFFAEGVVAAWKRAVEQGGVIPDEGLLLQVLATCARAGEVTLALKAYKKLEKVLHSQLKPMQEWHLSPVLEAYCHAGEYALAMRFIGNMRRKGIALSWHHSLTLGASIANSGDPDAAQQVIAAANRIGNDQGATGGLDVIAFNGVLHAAALSNDPSKALTFFHNAPQLRGVREAVPLATSTPRMDSPFSRSSFPLEPNEESYNMVLSAHIQLGDPRGGRAFLREMLRKGLAPNATTYEKAILLELIHTEGLGAAFDYLEEAKSKELVPTMGSYEALIWKCYELQDPRWKMLLVDMSQVGLGRPAKKVQRFIKVDTEEKWKRLLEQGGGGGTSSSL
ncbi:hypothetical protein K437DRAFT_269938 [Tilletiaria anomala UBC 951]|uniref:Pentatricopeptide repeat-containing protein-mitochondrial domain-containing protein n=1 Tax=Tilletiaria anomala (strain ATCC 24038 / CBS 436.72 / UBC 951) TaxID=1037660 RepID=A0A066VP99_TILAU|nr:uncharacterized protein K437DRAFT_269938 [Tilletiaria anomala UBC 951]KDN40604.1 hypothetical protein K437DRAFT_269938 [Tilletiaria anomala UBC 951]